MSRSGAEIAAQIKSKAADTVKNEVIALSEEEFEEFINDGRICPVELGLVDVEGDSIECGQLPICTECWKKATGR